MYNELKLYCKSEGLSEYLRSDARIGSDKRDTVKNQKELREVKNSGSIKKAG